MATTYGQLGTTYQQYLAELKHNLTRIGIAFNEALAKKCWNKGMNVSDATSFFILK